MIMIDDDYNINVMAILSM